MNKQDAVEAIKRSFTDSYLIGQRKAWIESKIMPGINKFSEEEFVSTMRIIIDQFLRSQAFNKCFELFMVTQSIELFQEDVFQQSFSYVNGYLNAIEAFRMHETIKGIYHAMKKES